MKNVFQPCNIIIVFNLRVLIIFQCIRSGVSNYQDTIQADAATTKKPYLSGPDDLIKLARLEKQIHQKIGERDYDLLSRSAKEKLDSLRKWKSDYEDTSSRATSHGSLTGFGTKNAGEQIIAGHPLLTYRMMRRFNHEFPQVIQDLNDCPGNICQVLLNFIRGLEKKLRYKWPTNDDLNDSVNAILKIQHVYDLKATEIARGRFSEVETGVHLRFNHILEIARFAADTNQFISGLEWFKLALNMRENIKSDPRGFDSKDIQAEIVNMVENHNANWKIHSFGPDKMNYFAKKIRNISDINTQTVKQLGFKLVKGNRTKDSDLVDYYALCAGENLQTIQEISQLKCWFERKMSPELLVYPAKIEELSKDPQLLKIHEAIGPKVSQKFKKLSLSKQYVEIYKTKSANKQQQKHSYYNLRTSANSWVSDTMDASLRFLSRRIESITGLNVVGEFGEPASEDFEVVAYAYGGHFVLHNDALGEVKTELLGDRISTILFYLDDVVLGGRIVFPQVGVQVQPEAGSALFFNNLFPDGTIDFRIKHAACPVILGQKWSVNKCITEHGNFLKRKCPLSGPSLPSG